MSVTYKPTGRSRGTVFFGVGHGGNDPGAVKYLREGVLNLQQALYAKDYMVANGFTVVMSRNKNENDPLTEEIREANAIRGLLCAVDFHNNAGGGDGFEAYYGINSNTNGSKGLAQAIEREVKVIGQNSRGCKIKKNSRGLDYFGFIRRIRTRAVIIEGCFVDNKADAAQFDSDAEVKAYGYAVAKGVINWLENTGKVGKGSHTTPSSPGTPSRPSTSKPNTSSSSSTYRSGNIYTLQANMKVRTGASTKYRNKRRNELTVDGRKHAKAGYYAILKKGTKVTCKGVVYNGSEIWLKIPSGYICAKRNGKCYIA